MLMIKNHSVLGKLRARRRYCEEAIKSVESDTYRMYGPFSGFWDEWVSEVEDLRSALDEHVPVTILFLEELNDFLISLGQKKRLSKSDNSYLAEVTRLTEDKLQEQIDFLIDIDERITIHKQITRQLLLVEAIDTLD